MKSTNLTSLAFDNGELTDVKIKRYVLEGHYGAHKQESELINCNSGTFRAALEGHYGLLCLKKAREIRDSGLRRTIVRGPKPRVHRTPEEIIAELDAQLEQLELKNQ